MLKHRMPIGTIAPITGLPSLLSEFFKSYAQMLQFSIEELCGPDQYIHQAFPLHSLHDLARNQLANTMRGEWLLQLDTDHQFEPDLLVRLVNAMTTYDADVVTGLYLHRSPPYGPTLWKFDEDGNKAAFHDWPNGEVLEVDCAGSGCLLVRRRVFDRIWDELGEEPFSRTEFEGRDGRIVVGEDFAFFRRLQKLGIKTICPTYIECHHLDIRPLKYANDYINADSAYIRDDSSARLAGAKKRLPSGVDAQLTPA